jgi:tRNA nucleotidyltransferase/poly(A) polymerase
MERGHDALAAHVVHPAEGLSVRVDRLLELISSDGVEAWVCGGAVRDALLDQPFQDIDVVVRLPVERIHERLTSAFGAACVRRVLRNFGVVTIGADCAREIDVAMYRSADAIDDAVQAIEDVVYSCGASLEADARNRDVTINCCYWNPREGFLDPIGCAFADIGHRRIRVAADPRKCRVDRRLSFRILLFVARGFQLTATAAAYLQAHLAADVHRFGPTGLDPYLRLLTRDEAEVEVQILRTGLAYLDDARARRMFEAAMVRV